MDNIFYEYNNLLWYPAMGLMVLLSIGVRIKYLRGGEKLF